MPGYHRGPDVPIVAESYPGYEFSFFVGVSAPRGVPANVASAIHDAIDRARDDRAIREQLEKPGLRLPRGEYARFVALEIERWRLYADAAGLIPQ